MKNSTLRMTALILALSLLTLTACSKDKGNDPVTETTTEYSEQTEATEQDSTAADETQEQTTATEQSTVLDEITTAPTVTDPTLTPSSTDPTLTPSTEASTAAPTPDPTKVSDENVYAAYTKAQVLSLLTAAVNKTKAYTGDITVHHTESFDMNVSNVSPGGALSQRAINFVVGLVAKPTEEDYKFSNGLAVTSEGEETQLLLPKAAAFTLPERGVKTATAEQGGNLIHVVLTLNAEECTSITAVPEFNAASIGYLNLDGKFSTLNITEMNIKYPGSVIDAYINASGYVTSVTYTINMDAHGEASALGIDGSADFNGVQIEKWEINW